MRRVGTSRRRRRSTTGEAAAAAGSPTLYERLGRGRRPPEGGRARPRRSAAKELATKVTPQQFGTLLVEASSGERPSNVPVLSGPEWDRLKQAIAGRFRPRRLRSRIATRSSSGCRREALSAASAVFERLFPPPRPALRPGNLLPVSRTACYSP